MAGETVTVTVTVRNGGQTPAGTSTLALYDGNPASGGTLIGEGAPSVAGESETEVSFTWTPAAPGPHRLFARADRDDAVSEFDEGNNQTWRDVYIGIPSPVNLDSGGDIAADPPYTTTLGYGYLSGVVDTTCGSQPGQSYRRDAGGQVTYRFDHLLPGHFYHLDLNLHDCHAAPRLETVYVDNMQVISPSIDLSDGQPHRLSILLDPAFYADHTISVAVESPGFFGAIVNEISLTDVDYRYIDAGSATDLPYTAERGYGYLDGDASTGCGTLPYQSVRVNQSGNHLRYRFDRLDPQRSYQVNLTFHQCFAPSLPQTIAIDGLTTGPQLDIGQGQTHQAVVPVPAALYQGDGSIIVDVTLLQGGIGAFVNEIALEELTLPRTTNPVAPTCNVQTTPYYSDVYGALLINDELAPAGSLVEALNPRGDVVGCTVTDRSGQYGAMRVYGEDPGVVPGMRAGEVIAFRVNGQTAPPSPTLAWQNDHDIHQVDLNVGGQQAQIITLGQRWNLLSINVQPPTTAITQVLSSINGRYDRVLGEQGTFVPGLPSIYNTLHSIEPGRSYWLRTTGTPPASMVVNGTPAAADTPLALHVGWNWPGYLPQASHPVTEALASIAGLYDKVDSATQTFIPGSPASTLTQMEPGAGYLIRMTAAGTLIYPAGGLAVAQGLAPLLTATPEEACDVPGTPYFSEYYGQALLDGAPLPVGSRVDAFNPRGDRVGCFIVTSAGNYGFLRVYGEDADADPPIPGMRAGEEVTFALNHHQADAGPAITWQDDRDIHPLTLTAESSTPLPCVVVDLSTNGQVDAADLAQMGAAWGRVRQDVDFSRRADLDGDGDVDIRDVQWVAAAWERSCGNGEGG